MAKHNVVGTLGEDIAVKFISKKGLKVLERNYWQPYGELDIVAKDKNNIVFVEVKTVSCEINQSNNTEDLDIQPEDNMHPGKIKRLRRIIEVYLMKNSQISDWRLDLVFVFLDQKVKKARIRWIKDIII